ncbi:MAG: hypothetical protein U0228_16110 [Myxococcaceae bacterium]
MRRRAHVFTLIATLVLAHRGRADTLADALKREATAAFRAGRFDVACPLFEKVVQTSKYDAWGWNDLALCRVRALAFDGVLEPLQKAAALEKVVGDEPLKKAIATNEGLLAKALQAHPGEKGVGLPAAVLGVHRYDAEDLETGCPLLELSLASGEVVLEAAEWARVATCRVSRGASSAGVLAALQSAHQGGAPIEAIVDRLVERDRQARPDASDWQKRCVPLDGKACSRHWLLCTAQAVSEQDSYVSTTTERMVVIEAGTMSRWKRRSPFDLAAENELASTTTREYVRCGAPPGMPGMNAVGEGLTEHLVLAIDPCTATAAVWDLSVQCESDGGRFTTVAVTPVSPPK